MTLLEGFLLIVLVLAIAGGVWVHPLILVLAVVLVLLLASGRRGGRTL